MESLHIKTPKICAEDIVYTRLYITIDKCKGCCKVSWNRIISSIINIHFNYKAGIKYLMLIHVNFILSFITWYFF